MKTILQKVDKIFGYLATVLLYAVVIAIVYVVMTLAIAEKREYDKGVVKEAIEETNKAR